MRRNLFAEEVLKIVQRIPKGKTLSYKQVAYLAGNPGAARAVGAIMRVNKNPEIPCHRVIRSDGTLGGYNGGVEKKKMLLRHEQAPLAD